MSRADLLEKIAARAAETRAAQRAYFAASRAGAYRGDELTTARRLERELDQLLEQLAAPTPRQRGLFEEEP
jgi:hypothetical protein